MPEEINASSAVGVAALIALLLSAAIVVWMAIFSRWAHGRALAVYERRRPAPWGAFDIAVVFGAYFLLTALIPSFALGLLRPEQRKPLVRRVPPPQAESNVAKSDWIARDSIEGNEYLAENKGQVVHPIVHLIRSRLPSAVVLAAALALFIAPLSEEMIFRVVMQGGMEAMARRQRLSVRWLRRCLPVVVPALVFGLLHWNSDSKEYPREYYIALLSGVAVGATASLVFAIGWLKVVRRATWADLGISTVRWKTDVGLGLASFAALAVPIYSLQLGLTLFMPKGVAPDPLGIFLFALAWGYLYRQSHRIGPSLISHMALNATSLTAALLLM